MLINKAAFLFIMITLDFSKSVFLGQVLSQEGYDREIDEGMSSGMKRYVTLDITALSEEQAAGVLESMVSAKERSNLKELARLQELYPVFRVIDEGLAKLWSTTARAINVNFNRQEIERAILSSVEDPIYGDSDERKRILDGLGRLVK